MNKNDIIWNNIWDLTQKKGWTLVELAEKAKTRPQSINSIKSGFRGIGPNLIKRISNALGVDEIELYKVHVPEVINKPIPVISWVHAGAFAEAADIWPVGVSGEGDPVFSSVKTGPNTFGLRVEGNSMLPRFMPGDVAIVDPAIRCDNGCACVVLVNGEASLKLFYEYEAEIVLRPMNDKYPETTIRKDSKVDFKIIGKVVDIRPKL